MRDRLLEFLPLLLVLVVLAGYQVYRTRDAPSVAGSMALQPLPTAMPTPIAAPRPSVVAAVAPAGGGDCLAGQPRFVGRLAVLRASLGGQMGDATDCEYVVDTVGDTQQTTTTGLAYYRKLLRAPCFTTGYDHWSLSNDGSVVHWTGDSVDPPD